MQPMLVVGYLRRASRGAVVRIAAKGPSPFAPHAAGSKAATITALCAVPIGVSQENFPSFAVVAEGVALFRGSELQFTLSATKGSDKERLSRFLTQPMVPRLLPPPRILRRPLA
jgi:hypothetical protein